jgi:hypothetical protein
MASPNRLRCEFPTHLRDRRPGCPDDGDPNRDLPQGSTLRLIVPPFDTTKAPARVSAGQGTGLLSQHRAHGVLPGRACTACRGRVVTVRRAVLLERGLVAAFDLRAPTPAGALDEVDASRVRSWSSMPVSCVSLALTAMACSTPMSRGATCRRLPGPSRRRPRGCAGSKSIHLRLADPTIHAHRCQAGPDPPTREASSQGTSHPGLAWWHS